MTTTPDAPLNDDDIETVGSTGSQPLPGGDADGTDGDGTDGDSTDSTDGDGTDSDGTDS